MLPLVFDVDEVEQEETRLLTETLAGWRTEYPDVEVVDDVARAPAAKALIGASTRAEMMIVGSHHPRLRDAALGSVAHADSTTPIARSPSSARSPDIDPAGTGRATARDLLGESSTFGHGPTGIPIRTPISRGGRHESACLHRSTKISFRIGCPANKRELIAYAKNKNANKKAMEAL